MFTGRHYHNIEAKGRLAIPSDYREKLASGCVITVGLDGCLFLFPNSYWQQLSEKLANLPLTNSQARQFVRLIIQQASEVSFDQQGRILIPDYLREKAQLQKQTVVAGALTRIEIWDKQVYHTHLDLITQENPNWEEGLSSLYI